MHDTWLVVCWPQILSLYLVGKEHASPQGMYVCIGYITAYVLVCCVSASMCSDSHYCGLCSVFKAHAQTTDLSCPEVLLVQHKFFFFSFSPSLFYPYFPFQFVCVGEIRHKRINQCFFSSLLASVSNISTAHAGLCFMWAAWDKMHICIHLKTFWDSYNFTLSV